MGSEMERALDYPKFKYLKHSPNGQLTCNTGLAMESITLCAISRYPLQLKITSHEDSDVSSLKAPSRISSSIALEQNRYININCPSCGYKPGNFFEIKNIINWKLLERNI